MPPKSRSDGSPETQQIISAMKDEFEKMREDMNEMKELLATKTGVIESLTSEVDILKNRVASLEENLDSADAYERRDTVIISGSIPPNVQGEITSNVAIGLISEKLGLRIQTTDISTAHRLPRRSNAQQTQGSKPPSIIIKLCRRDLKRNLIHASKQQPKQSHDKIFVNESLTPQRSAILRTLIRMKRGHPIIKGVTTQDGRVVAFTETSTQQSRDDRHIINSRINLQKFCDQFVRKPLEEFIENWPQT